MDDRGLSETNADQLVSMVSMIPIAGLNFGDTVTWVDLLLWSEKDA